MPSRWDWRAVGGRDYVGSAKNQGQCATGISFDVCAVIEASVRAKCRNPDLEIDLSEAFLFFCAGGSCHKGLNSSLLAVLGFAAVTGIVDEACMPFETSSSGIPLIRPIEASSRSLQIVRT